jgi:hypothetical protein
VPSSGGHGATPGAAMRGAFMVALFLQQASVVAATAAAAAAAVLLPPPRSPPEHFHSCIPELRRHCADADATSHARCLGLIPPSANCTELHVTRFRAENCAQYSKYGGLINVQLAFGAVADGGQPQPTDNTDAIRRAVNATR